MKAKITEVDPTGVPVKMKEFYVPLLKKRKVELIQLEDGTIVKGEPMKQNRYFIEIGEYVYFVGSSGRLDLAGNKKDISTT
jgi:hypothetical protein